MERGTCRIQRTDILLKGILNVLNNVVQIDIRTYLHIAYELNTVIRVQKCRFRIYIHIIPFESSVKETVYIRVVSKLFLHLREIPT